MKTLPLSLLVFASAFVLACRTPLGPLADAAPISVAVVPFGVAFGSPPPPFDVARAIAADLAISERYAAVAVTGEAPEPRAWTAIDADSWRRAGADYVVVGIVGMVHDGGHELEFLVVDTRTGFSVVGYQVPSAPDQLATAVRRIADVVHQRLTGEQAGFATRGDPRVAEK